MPLKEIMNTDGSLAHDTGSPVSGGSFTITSSPSTKNKAKTKFMYRGVLNFTFSGGNISGYDPNTIVSASPGSINPTATKKKPDGQFVLRKDDIGTMMVTGTISGVPTPFPSPVPVKISISGQDKVTAQ